MVPIFEQGEGQGIGLSFDRFLKRFISICEEHLDNGRAKSFAFILYDFSDKQIKDEILKKQGGFAQLDRLSGKDLSIFYLHSDNEDLLNAFNEIFLGAFEIKSEFKLPFVLFFNVIDSEVEDIKVVELEQTDLLFAFKELYDIIENYVDLIKNKKTAKIKPTTNTVTEFIQTARKIALEKFIKFLFEQGLEKAHSIF